MTWSTTWASDTIVMGKPAFTNLVFASVDDQHHWAATLPPGYSAAREDLQQDQVIKAGARLAQLLAALFD